MVNCIFIVNNLDENFKWLPPEAKTCEHVLDKSDSWSLACVILKLMYCGLNNQADIRQLMKVVRGNGEIPNEMAEQFKKV